MASKKTKNQLVIEELIKTVSGKLLLKQLSTKKETYYRLLNEALQKYAKEVEKKNLNVESIKHELEPLINGLLEKSRLVDDFFKFSIRKEKKPTPEHPQILTQSKKQTDQLKTIDSFFNS